MLELWGEWLGTLYGVDRTRYVQRFHETTRYIATTGRLAPDVLVRRARELARAARAGGVALLLRDHAATGRQH